MDEAVQSTNDWMAAIRAHETARADRYLRDPYATLLTGPDPEGTLAALRAMNSPVDIVIVRGRFGDEALTRALARGVRQAVSLGAGTDTRGYRLDLPEDLVLYELDLPGRLAAKHHVLATAGLTPSCRISPVETDLRGDWTSALAAAGHRPDRPTAWIVEGLFYYLDPATADTLLGQLTARSAPGSSVQLDIPADDYLTDPANTEWLAYLVERGSPFLGHTADPTGWLAGHGWTAESYQPTTLDTCPWLPPPPARLTSSYRHLWHVHATR
ncbi:putative S-adenosyl-L-methionine-dependent methyltransferase [Longispora fulva]|uniref:S-adenosyl-L-methionine-dependent methyltransferase n=1 Tax=Longispora fulva TaxID=619741 RepID=A0A8J7GQS3_9ACTN|nr:SAM-dependent methyltransferase [Longispora fulva]MBG6137189.1 methyltransferase (TIGR00027 family) [Longispora fulva]GIG61457.1 putative S-adenosyl-L-methionine-dependent methyltransferase [Longispora fulva]